MPTGIETSPPPMILEEGSGGVESTLNRLDDAVNMLASLHGHTTTRGRRGKIDLAALVWEVAPEARVQLEMDESTTVFAMLEWAGAPYEAELRPLLHDGTVRANGHPLDHRVRLVPGTRMDMGPFRLELRYPASMMTSSSRS